MLPSGAPSTVNALLFRLQGDVIDPNTIVGHVNIYFFAPIPVQWQSLGALEFPTFPAEATGIVTSPSGVVTDPSTCTVPGCPLVFKFTVKRVAP